ncbi:hypothetical protein [Nitrosophilus alvini]|uniref:hypothetical protein n=1 Tax=Nitrosophilus alvini TaxID=2714855 RepID=UPI00190BC5E1|nr:hypothetical protein [Nitrosophilus alvini]
MNIDLKHIIIEQFISMFESHIGLIAITFSVAAVVFIFRYDIAFYFDLSKREQNKLTETTLLLLIFIVITSIGYLYIKQHYFLLSVGLSVILTYFLYAVGLLDMIVEKLEGRYGR